MEFYVIGADGKEYGPATIDTLREWAVQGRLLPNTQLKNYTTGQVTPASAIAGIFPAGAGAAAVPPPAGQWSAPPSPYQRPAQPAASSGGDDVFTRSLVYSGISLVFVFVLGGLGLITGIFSLVYAVKAQQSGHKHGVIAIAVAAVAATCAIVGLIIRTQHGPVYR